MFVDLILHLAVGFVGDAMPPEVPDLRGHMLELHGKEIIVF